MTATEQTLNAAADHLKAIRGLLESSAIAPALIDRRTFAALLSVGETTLDTLRGAGKIGPSEVRLGGGIRWLRAEVEAWLLHRSPTGELHDVKTWPAIWTELQRRKK